MSRFSVHIENKNLFSAHLLESALHDRGPVRASSTLLCGFAIRLHRFRDGDASALAPRRRLRFDRDRTGLSNATSSSSFDFNLSIAFCLVLRYASLHLSSNLFSSHTFNFSKSPASCNARNKAVLVLCFVYPRFRFLQHPSLSYPFRHIRMNGGRLMLRRCLIAFRQLQSIGHIRRSSRDFTRDIAT